MTDPFSIPAFSFPDDFIWGSATAGHQIEGNNVNSSNWFWEKEEIAKDPNWGEPSSTACNSYEMYEEDNLLLSKLSHKMYRMSIEWARIEPNEGEFSEEALNHYIKIFESLKEKGIKLCLTLVHVSVPEWFHKKGWFYDIKNLPYFERYLHHVVPKVEKYVDRWIVLNETFSSTSINEDAVRQKINCLKYHARGYTIIKQYSNKMVSSAHAFVLQSAKRKYDELDSVMEKFRDYQANGWLFNAIRTGEVAYPFTDAFYDEEIKNSFDFWAINTYVKNIVDSRKKNLRSDRLAYEKMKMISKDFYLDTFNPDCVFTNLSRLKDKPVLITENGCSSDNDDFRIIWITEYLSVLSEAIKDGVNVTGYLYWSLLDNYEWNSFAPKFGLVAVDRENGFKRTIKNSGYFLKEIIENNGYKPEMLKKYLSAQPKL